MKKRFMSILLILCMALNLLPMVATATDTIQSGGSVTKTLDDGWYNLRVMNNYLNIDASGTVTGVPIEMAHIPAGTFTMGKRVVTISKPFYMGKYEVTQAQYKSVMGNNPSLFQGTGTVTQVDANGVPHTYKKTPASGENPAKRPVDRVNWYNAIVFCNKLSMKEGLSPAYRIAGMTDPSKWGKMPTRATGNSKVWDAVEIVQGSNGYRLPTEAQWEYACRAGTTTKYNTGDAISDNTGWHFGNSDSQTHEVGKKTSNAWGLYDMHGNVVEWCWDWYNPDLPLYPQTDPAGPKAQVRTNNTRTIRGGDFVIGDPAYPLWDGSSAWRFNMFIEYDEPYVGFRVMRPDSASLPDTGKPVIQGMAWIPGGTFTIGSPKNEVGRNSNENQQQRTVDGFYMGIYEVTQAQYASVMQLWPSYYRRQERIVEGEDYDSRPVEQVSWYDAIRFCNKLSMKEGLSPAYRISGSTDPAKWGLVPTASNAKWDAVEIVQGSNGYRLPTEVQWEYACRAGTTTTYNTGKNTLITDASKGVAAIATDNTAWYFATSQYRDDSQKTHEVGMLAPNAWGLWDMHGNVSEWCWSATSSGNRHCRGGNYMSNARSIRSATRGSVAPTTKSRQIGIRLVRPYSESMPTGLVPVKSEPTSTSKTPYQGPLEDGWYVLKLHRQNVVFNTSGVMVVGNASSTFYVENKGNNRITIKTADGKYVGIRDSIKRGALVKKVASPYLWYITFESGGIRPATDTKFVAVIAEGYKYSTSGGSYTDGSRIALTQRVLPNANNPEVDNARFEFYSTPAPKRYKK